MRSLVLLLAIALLVALADAKGGLRKVGELG